MAKQSGLHQIRGKVGEHSYYRQTGVSSGLIRSINQGMSARVKNDEAYANTRLNNQEFALAAEIAGRLGTFPQPKFRPMVLPFSQAKMAKNLLNLARTTSAAAWGWRGIGAADFSLVLKALNDTAKYPFENMISDLSASATTTSVGHESWLVNFEEQTGIEDLLQSIGATGFYLKLIAVNVIYTDPVKSTLTKGSFSSRTIKSVVEDPNVESGLTDGIDITDVATPADPTSPDYHRVACVMVMPYREIAGDKNILQEYCSFMAIEVDAPSE